MNKLKYIGCYAPQLDEMLIMIPEDYDAAKALIDITTNTSARRYAGHKAAIYRLVTFLTNNWKTTHDSIYLFILTLFCLGLD